MNMLTPSSSGSALSHGHRSCAATSVRMECYVRGSRALHRGSRERAEPTTRARSATKGANQSFEEEEDLDRGLADELDRIVNPQKAQKQMKNLDLLWSISKVSRLLLPGLVHAEGDMGTDAQTRSAAEWLSPLSPDLRFASRRHAAAVGDQARRNVIGAMGQVRQRLLRDSCLPWEGINPRMHGSACTHGSFPPISPPALTHP
jgi:hypothetical protein